RESLARSFASRSYIRPRAPSTTPFPYTTLFRSVGARTALAEGQRAPGGKARCVADRRPRQAAGPSPARAAIGHATSFPAWRSLRSEEHTSALQSHLNLVCRLLLEKKKTMPTTSE